MGKRADDGADSLAVPPSRPAHVSRTRPAPGEPRSHHAIAAGTSHAGTPEAGRSIGGFRGRSQPAGSHALTADTQDLRGRPTMDPRGRTSWSATGQITDGNGRVLSHDRAALRVFDARDDPNACQRLTSPEAVARKNMEGSSLGCVRGADDVTTHFLTSPQAVPREVQP
jgi:hypothetical protein